MARRKTITAGDLHMVTYRIQGLKWLHVVAQSVLVLTIFWGWVAFLFEVMHYDPTFAFERYAIFSGMLVVGLLVDSARSGRLKLNVLELEPGKANRITLQQTGVILGALLLFLVAIKDQTISRVFLFSFIPVLYTVLFLSNRFLPGVLANFLFSGRRTHRTLLLGPSYKASQLKSWLKRKARYGIQAIGLLTDESQPVSLDDIPWLGSIEETEEVIRRTGATQVIMVEMPNSSEAVNNLADVCVRLGVRFMVVHDLDDKLRHPIYLIEDDGLYFIGLHREPLESPVNRLLKRILDLAISIPVVILVLPPVTLFVWLVQRLQSPGSIFCYQQRSGIQNKVFRLFKFRTMQMNHGTDVRQACHGDPRVYPAGRWLRRASMDELPQFINVLRGEMSVVGPRPHMIEHNERFAQIKKHYQVRTFIKPGLTGLAQVRGYRGEIRTDDDLVARVEADIHYIENWSIGLDWKIVFQTAWQMVSPPHSAY